MGGYRGGLRIVVRGWSLLTDVSLLLPLVSNVLETLVSTDSPVYRMEATPQSCVTTKSF